MKIKHILFILLVLTVLGLYGYAATAGVAENIAMEPLRDVLEKWVETKQLISREKQQWETQKEILAERTRLLDRQAGELEDKIKKLRTDMEKSEEKGKHLAKEHEKLEAGISVLEKWIGRLEIQVVKLLSQLPDPLQKQVKPLSQEIPANPKSTELSVSIRYQNLIGILNFMNKFNNAVTVTTEIRKLNGDQAVEVEVMYLGLGQAYFSNQATTVGGVGHPTLQGWKWERCDDIAPAVSSAIAMYNNQQPADYVSLPVEIVDLGEKK